jgi:hypothetical protein
LPINQIHVKICLSPGRRVWGMRWIERRRSLGMRWIDSEGAGMRVHELIRRARELAKQGYKWISLFIIL